MPPRQRCIGKGLANFCRASPPQRTGPRPYVLTPSAPAASGAPWELIRTRAKIARPSALNGINIVREIPLVRGHKFVKFDDRIVVVDPKSRVVVAMMPRYKLLP
jgi:hypothetical protein